MGIHGSLLLWFQYYLTSCRQCVWVGDSHSQFCDVISGVSQGSILRPLLFVIYVRMSMICLVPCTMPSPICLLTIQSVQLPQIIAWRLILYNLIYIVNLSTWSSFWSLLFNEFKFVHMCFWQKSTDCPHIHHINSKAISKKTQHEDLGVILTNDLNWSPHYNSIINQFYKILELVCRAFTHSTCMSIYILLVCSQLLAIL